MVPHLMLSRLFGEPGTAFRAPLTSLYTSNTHLCEYVCYDIHNFLSLRHTRHNVPCVCMTHRPHALRFFCLTLFSYWTISLPSHCDFIRKNPVFRFAFVISRGLRLDSTPLVS